MNFKKRYFFNASKSEYKGFINKSLLRWKTKNHKVEAWKKTKWNLQRIPKVHGLLWDFTFWAGAFSTPSVTELLEFIKEQCCPFKKYTCERAHTQRTGLSMTISRSSLEHLQICRIKHTFMLQFNVNYTYLNISE